MSILVQQFLNSFEQLPEQEKRELATEIIKRSIMFQLPSLTEDELILNAEELFLELDKRELSNE